MRKEVQLTLTLFALSLYSCSTPLPGAPPNTPAPTPISIPGEPVHFSTEDGVRLAGHLSGDPSGGALVLLHEFNSTQAIWAPLVQAASDSGWASLTFDLRGTGQSEGAPYLSKIVNDLQAASDFLRDHGSGKVVLVGAGAMSAYTLRAAPRVEPAGLVLLSPIQQMMLSETTNLRIPDRELHRVPGAKLILVAEEDQLSIEPRLGVSENGMEASDPVIIDYPETAQRMAGLLPDPVVLTLVPGERHGSDLLYGPQSEAVLEAINGFLTAVFSLP